MHRGKSIAHREHRITASSSSSDDNNNVSLGADQKEAPEAHASTHNVVSSTAMPQRKAGSFHNRMYSPKSTRRSGRMTFQCKFVLL